VAGKLNAMALRQKVMAGHGKAMLTTVQGEMLMVTTKGRKLIITDSKGGMASVTIPDVNQSNGVIHVIDSVLLP